MPHLALWYRMLAQTRGAATAALLAARAQARYDQLYARRTRYANRALRGHLGPGVLPVLAMYQVLREENDDQANAIAEMETLKRVSRPRVD